VAAERGLKLSQKQTKA